MTRSMHITFGEYATLRTTAYTPTGSIAASPELNARHEQ